jgi:type IV secretory pathway TrbD component
MNTSENRSWAVTGLVTIALWVAGVFLITKAQPGDHATGSDILAWYRSHTTTIILGGWLFMLGCLGFVTFVNGLRQRLAAAAGPDAQLPWLTFAGAVMTGALGLLFASTDVAGAIDKTDINATTAAAFHHLGDAFFVGVELAAILPLAAVAIVAWRTGVLPRWWAVVSGLIAIVLVVGPIGWAAVIFGLPIWTLGTSLFVLLRSPERMRAAAAAA